MRPVVLALCILFLFGTAHIVRAYYDDSVVIEIGNGLPSESSTSTPLQSGTSTDTGGDGSPTEGPSASGSAGSGTGGSSGSGGTGSSSNSSSSDSGSPGGGDANSSGDSSSVGSTPPQHDANAIENDLFDLLVAQGVITGTETETSNAGQGAVNSIRGFAGGGGKITINAAKLRAVLQGNNSFRQILDDFSASVRGGMYRRGLSEHDVGLMAASTVLGDTNIDELTFGATKFEMVYRSRGYLLGFIPQTFPVRISVDPQASVASDQVALSLPWYQFFVRKLFSPSALASEIDAVVAADVRTEGDTPADVQARLFEAVSRLLQEKVGTIGVSR